MQLPTPPAGGSFVSFKNVGDSVTGHVVEISGNGKTMQGEPCPLVVLDVDGALMNVTCSQTQLWSKTVASVEAGELAVGKRAKFTYTQNEARPGGKTLKHFDIKVGEPDPAFASRAAAQAEPF